MTAGRDRAHTTPPHLQHDLDHGRRQLLVVLLAVVSGSTDAIAFLALGGAFTSVMTGNLVLLGVGASTADGAVVLSVGGAVVAFCVGAAAGTVLAGAHRDGDAVWPRRVTLALAVEAVLFVGYGIGWWSAGAAPGATASLVLLSVTAVAMGVQSSAVQRFGVPGLSSTYLTGTLTTIVIRLTSRRGVRDVLPSVQVVTGLVAGATIAGALVAWAPLAAPAVQIGLLVVVLGVAARGTRRRRAAPTGPARAAPTGPARTAPEDPSAEPGTLSDR